jgi:hypothetical protein
VPTDPDVDEGPSVPEAADRVAAETWFLQRGLPSVLTRRARWRRLWRLAGYATVAAGITVIAIASGGLAIDIDDDPTPAQWLILGVLAAIVPLALLVTWLVSRIESPGRRRNASWAGRVDGVVTVFQVTALTLVLNGLGIGSMLGWAVRLTVSHLASAGALVTRALPVVLLTVLVFFNGYVWSMATKIGRDRMWLVVGFMVLIVMASQVTQIATVAVVTAAIFFVMGLLVLSPEVLAAWTTNGTDQGTWLGMTLPVPQPLIQVTMFLGALTFMYVSARSVGDGEYRKEFLEPLVDDLRLNLVARNRSRARVREGL